MRQFSGKAWRGNGRKFVHFLRARAAKIEMLGRLFVGGGAFSYAAHHMCEKVESHDFFQEFFFFLPPPIFSHTQFLSAARPSDQGEESVILLVVGRTVLRSPMYTQKGSFFYFLGQNGRIKKLARKKREALKVFLLLFPIQNYQKPRHRSVNGSLSCLPPTGVKRKREKNPFSAYCWRSFITWQDSVF